MFQKQQFQDNLQEVIDNILTSQEIILAEDVDRRVGKIRNRNLQTIWRRDIQRKWKKNFEVFQWLGWLRDR